MNQNKLFVMLAFAVSLMIAVTAFSADSEAGGSDATLSLSSAEYDIDTDMLTFSGDTSLSSFWFVITDSEGREALSGQVAGDEIANGKFVSEVSFKRTGGEYVLRIFEGPVDSILEDEITFMVTSVKLTSDQTNVTITENQSTTVSLSLSNGSYSDVRITSSHPNIASVSALGSDGKFTIYGKSIGNATIYAEVIGKGVTVKIDVTVNMEIIPEIEKEFTFSLKMEMDWEVADFGTSGFSEDDLRTGITLKGVGTNAGMALENVCNSKGIPNEFISTHDGNKNDLRYWVVQIFGLRDVPLEGGDWKYWVQEYNGTYNQKTLGWFTDNSGLYTLTYKTTSVDYGNEVQSIYVKTQPTKTEYEVGESFDPTGMVVMAKMSVGEDLQIHKYTVSPSKFSQPGDQKVTLTYRDKTATVNVKVTGDAIPVIPPITPDIPIEDEKTETHTEHDDKGNTTTTTTTTGKTQDGKDVEINEVVVSKTDGSSEGTKTQTVTGKDGSVSETVTFTDKDKDGNVKETVTGTTTDNKGNVTKTESESKLDKDGNGKTVSTTTVTGKDGSTMTKSSTSEKSKDGTETEETVIAQSKDGNVRTETTSKVGTDGKVEAESKTTVKADAGKEVGADTIEGALKQSDVTLANVSADKKDVKKVVELEVSNGTSAALSPEAVKKVSDYGAGLKVSGSEGSIDTDSDVLKNLAKDGKSVELSMEANNKDVLKEKQKDIVGDNHFVDLNALVGGENVHQLGGKAVITFGYQLKDGESAVDLKVFYVDDEGNKTLVDATFANGSFTMTVDHFSVYMVENTAAPAPVDPDTPDEDKDEGGISPVLIAGILVVIIAAIVGVVLHTRKN